MNDGGPLALGVGFFGVVAPRWSPLMFGLGFGFMTVSEESARGPVVLWTQSDLQLTTTTVVRSAQLRHAEALVRFEPFGGIVRPFVEGTLGVVAVW